MEASSPNQIKMTEFWLEHDRKMFTPTLTLEHARKFTPTYINHWTWPKNVSKIYCSVIFTMLMFVVMNFLVMLTNFGHIHLVILNRSSEFSSLNKIWFPVLLNCMLCISTNFWVLVWKTNVWKWQPAVTHARHSEVGQNTQQLQSKMISKQGVKVKY